jgi:hypothetical protein
MPSKRKVAALHSTKDNDNDNDNESLFSNNTDADQAKKGSNRDNSALKRRKSDKDLGRARTIKTIRMIRLMTRKITNVTSNDYNVQGETI